MVYKDLGSLKAVKSDVIKVQFYGGTNWTENIADRASLEL